MSNVFRAIIVLMTMSMCMLTPARAQDDLLVAKRSVDNGGYKFWVYTPEDYFYTQEYTPLVLFLHGASLCGNDLHQVLRYGPINAVMKGRTIPAVIVAPQNPGGPWNPKKLNDILDWMEHHYAYDHDRVYVLGMSLGGYGTLDFVGTYPERVAAAMALCGGCTLKDVSRLGELPLWIIHGTADVAVNVKESQQVVSQMKTKHHDSRLRYDWLSGADHGVLARLFYTQKTYDWLFSHSRLDSTLSVNRQISIGMNDLQQAYSDIVSRAEKLEVIMDMKADNNKNNIKK